MATKHASKKNEKTDTRVPAYAPRKSVQENKS